MVVSISKIPDRIQREIYIQECSRIMDISEQVLISYGAIASESTTEVGKSKEEYNVRNCKSENPAAAEKVDVLYRLERKNNRDVVVVWR
jgi:DNA primase